MANLPTIFPDRPTLNIRPTWKCRARNTPSETMESHISCEATIADEETAQEPAAGAATASSYVTMSSSSSSTCHTDHDYFTCNTDKSSELLMQNIKENYPEFSTHYQEIFLKAEAYDKAIKDGSILTFDSICENDKLTRMYTGFPNFKTFQALFTYLEPKAKNLQYYGGGKRRKLSENFKDKGYVNKPGPERQTSLQEEFFMTLYRLRLGVPSQECAMRFGLKHSTYESIFNTWVVFIALELEDLCKINADVRCERKAKCFEDFPDVVIVVDCTELFAETPSSLKAHKQLFSNYKHHCTVKFLVGISPSGAITYVSPMFGGLASDKVITRASDDLVVSLKRGEEVMGDRAYTVQDDLPPGVNIVMPCSKPSSQTQLSHEQVIISRNISRARIHIERAIGRIKSFGLLEKEVKIASIYYFEYVFKACSFLVNFQSPFLKLSE